MNFLCKLPHLENKGRVYFTYICKITFNVDLISMSRIQEHEKKKAILKELSIDAGKGQRFMRVYLYKM